VSLAVTNTFQASVDKGHERLTRSWPSLMTTGAVGGIDVSIGLLAMVTVYHATGSRLSGPWRSASASSP
jgi:formate-nitrite transporter family protein